MSDQRSALFYFVSFICFCFLMFSAAFAWNGNEEFYRFTIVLSLFLFTIAGIILFGEKQTKCSVKIS